MICERCHVFHQGCHEYEQCHMLFPDRHTESEPGLRVIRINIRLHAADRHAVCYFRAFIPDLSLLSFISRLIYRGQGENLKTNRFLIELSVRPGNSFDSSALKRSKVCKY